MNKCRDWKKRIRLVGLMLILALSTSGFINGAFAKFSSTASGTATTYVAKWTFADKSAIDLTGIFAGEYTNVKSTDTAGRAVMAPGTSGSVNVSLISADSTWPEVAYSVYLALADESTGTSFDELGIQWCINDDGQWKSSVSEFNTYVKNTYFATVYNPGEGPAMGTSAKISWRWPASNSRDAQDTDLGIGSDGKTLSLKVEVVAMQKAEGHE